jgi:hypothetical protein
MNASEIKVGQHVLDRIVLLVLGKESGDQLGAPIYSVIARIVAKKVREGIRQRKQRCMSVNGDLADIDRMSREDLEDLCLERVRVCVS